MSSSDPERKTSKELVTLRKRRTKDGGYSLLLDYMIDGVRTRETLKLYLVPERTRLDRSKNNDTMYLAQTIKANRILELQGLRAGVRRRGKDKSLLDFLQEQYDGYMSRKQEAYAHNIHHLIYRLKRFGRKTTLHTVSKEYVLAFCDHLRRDGMSEGTVSLMFSMLSTAFNAAYRAGLMSENPIKRLERAEKPHQPDSMREYLTLAELKTLFETPCSHESARQAFLFSCFTGLRLSDIETLDWKQIRRNGDGWLVQARMHKNRKLIYVPLTENALAQLPSPMKEDGRIWDLLSRPKLRAAIAKWVKDAGITKHITFHSSRHTYATLLLTYGANIYTVSSLLGHSSVNTTQIYAKIVDENKRRTVNLIPDISMGKDRPE